MAVVRRTRFEERKDLNADVRIRLVEGDLDEVENQVSTLQEAMTKGLNRNNQLLLGILVSVTTAAILMALNLVVAS